VDNVIHIHDFDAEFDLFHNLDKSHDGHMVNISEMLLFDDNAGIFHFFHVQFVEEYKDQSNFED
jgi:hypothetical protein